MGFSGRLEGIAPSDIFQIISQNRMTGTLIARCQDGTAMIVFKDGQVIEAASDASQESLGFLLVSQGLVSEKVIETAEQQMKKRPDEPLGAILIGMGAISEKTLGAVVLKQIKHIFHRLVSCNDGFITFDRGETAVKRKINTREFMIPSGVSSEYLMMENARVIDEDRRCGTDRRSCARDTLPAGDPLQEASPSIGQQARSEAVAGSLFMRLGSLRLPRMAALRSAVETVVRKGNEFTVIAVRKGERIVGAAGDLVRGSIMPRLASAASTVRAFSPDGRALIYAGAAGIATGIALILLTALTFQPPSNELRITGRVVNLRATPTTKAKVVVKVDRGEKVSLLASEKGWYQVRTQSGAQGWIWNTLAERNKSTRTSVYGMTGSGFVLVSGLAILVIGILRKRRYGMNASAAPLQIK
jgi:hypothetical protein